MKTTSNGTRLSKMLRSLAVVALVVGSATLTLNTVGIASASVVQPLTKAYDKILYGDFTVIGNGNLECPSTPSPLPPQPPCSGGADRSNNAVNDNYDMRYADVDTDPLTYNSSISQLTVPTGATVDYARLNWAGDTGLVTLPNGEPYVPGCSINANSVHDPATLPPGGPDTQALRVTVGSGGTHSVSPQGFVAEPPPAADQPQYYSASADITSMFADVVTGSPVDVTVGNIWAPQGLNCFGGWSLTVVFAFPGPDPTYAPAPREIFVYNGHVRQDSSDPMTTVPINGFNYAGGAVRVGVTAYEGDWGISGDQFLVNGTPLAEPSTGDADNFFVSDAQGEVNPKPLNNFSVDAKSMVLPAGVLPVGATSLNVGFATSGDSFLDQQFALSVPLPSLTLTKEVCRSANSADCGPDGSGPWGKTATMPSGATAHWRITVRNPSSVDIPGVTLSDEAEPSCVTAAGTFTVLAGQQARFYCASANVKTAKTNTATAVFVPPGAPEGTPPVRTAPDSATADVYGLTVLKQTCTSLNAGDCGPGGAGPWASSATIPSGNTAYWRITTTDTGNVPITDIALDDPTTPACTAMSTAAPRTNSDKFRYCSTPDVTSAVTNTVSGSFAPPGSPEAPRQAIPPSSATVMVTGLAVVKEVCTASDAVACGPKGDGSWAKAATLPVGSTAYWRIRVTNTGEVDLPGVTIDDPAESSCVTAAGSFALGAGVSTSIYCSTANVTAAATNAVTASYLPPTAPPGTPRVTTSPASATVAVYGLTVLKEACTSLRAADCEPSTPCLTSQTRQCGAGTGPWAASATMPSGATAFWRITVTNGGSVPIDGITLSDAMEPSCVTSAGTFTVAAGTFLRFYCSTSDVTVALANSVTASYVPPGSPPGTPPTTTAPSLATVMVSDLAVRKEVCQSQTAADCGVDGAGPWATGASLPTGGTAYWRISVTNTGEVDLTGITLNDLPEASCAAAAGSFDLSIGATASFYCATTGVTAATTNTVTAQYLPPGAPPESPPVVTKPATAAAAVYGLVLTKEICQSLDAADCAADGAGPWASAATVPSGGTAYWRITATNTGTEDLTGITVVDKGEPSCADNAGAFSLVQGASTQIFCATPDMSTGTTNTAVALYTPPGGPPTATPPSSATVTVSNVTLVKEVCQSRSPSDCGTDGSGPWAKTATVPTAGTAFWRITVTNTGEVDLTGITLVDEAEASCVSAAGTFDLKIGDATQVFCSTPGLTGAMTNTVTASYVPPGVPDGTPPVTTPSDSATVDTAGLVVRKEVCGSPAASDCGAGGAGPWVKATVVPSGGTAFWRITVTGTGSADLTGITLADEGESSCAGAAGSFDLLAGASTQFYCSTSDVLHGMTNTVTATFTPPGGQAVTTDPDSAEVAVSNLTVVKEACRADQPSACDPGGSGPWAGTVAVPTGFDAHWRITVTNSGEVALTGITLADKVTPGCSTGDGFDLAVGATARFYCSTANLRSSVINTVVAMYPPVGAPPDSPPVVLPPASATADVSDLTVTKEVCQSQNAVDCGPDGNGSWGPTLSAWPGGTVFWRITVTNNSDIKVNWVKLVDQMQPSCGTAAGAFGLAAGQSIRFYCSTPNVTAGLTNTAVALYLSPGGLPIPVVTPPGSASVEVPHLVVTKRVCRSTSATDCGTGGAGPWSSRQDLRPGDTAYWRITVRNDGNVPVTTTVRDDREPSCVAAAGTFDLAVGAERDIYCATSGVRASMVNTAQAAFVPVGVTPGTALILSEPDSARVRVSSHEETATVPPAGGARLLARTGFPILPFAVTSLVGLLSGVVLLRAARRR